MCILPKSEGQLPKLEQAMHKTVFTFQFVPAAKHETSVNPNANLPLSNPAFLIVN